MAGAGAKKFAAFSKLASDDVNNYLADQVIMRFATTTARDAAFGGVGEPTLAEGMTAYIDADNTIYTYDGSNWVKMVSASQPVGLQLINSFPITTASTTCDNVFTDEFDNYRIVVQVTGLSNTNVGFIRVINDAGTTLNTGYFGKIMGGDLAGAGTTFTQYNTTSEFPMLWVSNSVNIGCSFTCDISHTRSATIATSVHGTHAGLSAGASWAGGLIMGIRQVQEKNRGFIVSNTAGTSLTGFVRVYGYRN